MRLRLITAALIGTAASVVVVPSLPVQASTVKPTHPHPAALLAFAARLRAAGLRGPALASALARVVAVGSAGPVGTRSTITGVVRGLRGAPLRGACVTAAGPAGSAAGVTGPDGRYTLTGLRPGPYTLAYRDCAAPTRFFRQFSGGLAWPSPASRVVVAAGQVRAIAPVTLRPTSPAALLQPSLRRVGNAPSGGTSRISGVVTGNGHRLGGICVTEWQLHNGFAQGFTKQTSRTGHYTFGHLPRGRYQMEFADNTFLCGHDGNWLPQWYKGITYAFGFAPPKAKVIRLKAGQAVGGIDASLRLGGEISGRVTNRSGRGLAGICVLVNGRIRGGFTSNGFATSRTGRYAEHALFPGRYTVGFSIGCGNKGNYAPQWWRRAFTLRRATPIGIIRHRIVTGVGAKLGPGAAITGVVRGTNSAGPPLHGVCVNASNRDGSIGAFTRTRSDGSYRLRGLPTGRFQISFDPRCSATSNYLGQSRMVSVTAGRTRTGINAFLQPGATVSGVVTDTHGHPVFGICVELQDNRGDFGSAETGLDGSYSADGLPTGSYTVAFSNCDNAASWAPQWYKDQASQAGADPLRLTAGSMTTGIDAVMQPGGTVTGVVTSPAGRRLSNVCVGVTSQIDASFGGFTDIEFTSNGAYQAQNLTPGPYLVNFGCGGGPYANQWFRKASEQNADLVSVGPGVVTSGIGAVIRPGGAITGLVTNRAGQRLTNICVYVANARTGVFGSGGFPVLTQSGRYRIDGLSGGRYKVLFTDCTGKNRYAAQWYKNRATLAAATPVRVIDGRTTKGISATMSGGGSISGTVRGPLGRPLRNICVTAFSAATQNFGFAVSNRLGSYRIGGLATGRYDVSFQPCDSTRNLVVVTKLGIRVQAPHARTGINATLSPGGTITGVVLSGSPAKPLANVCVEVFPIGPSTGFDIVQTGPNGGYTATGLGAGDYQVFFGDPFCFFGPTGFAPQWFNDQPTQAKANAVHVTVGATTSGIGATMQRGGLGTITGTVTGPSAAPVRGECATAFPVRVQDSSIFGSPSPEIAVTDGHGRYSLGFLLPGTYKVRFDVGCGASGFTTQWWKDAATRASATVITVTANATVTGVDARVG